MLSGQSAEIRKSWRHGRSDLPQRRGRLAQSKAALLRQAHLCKCHENWILLIFFFSFSLSFLYPSNHENYPPPNKTLLAQKQQIASLLPYPPNAHKTMKQNKPEIRRRTLRKTSCSKWTPPNTRKPKTCPTWPTLTMPLCFGTWKRVMSISLST